MFRKQHQQPSSHRPPTAFESLEQRCLMTGLGELAGHSSHASAELSGSDQETAQAPGDLSPAAQNDMDNPDITAIQQAIEETHNWRTESRLICTLAQAAAPSGSQTTPRPRDPLLPQGDPTPSRHLPRPSPIGAFRDGSVKTIHPDIDPRVLQLLREGGRAPIPWTTHRPGVGYGAPTNTLGGLDTTLRLMLEMQPNWEHGTGQMMHSYHGIRIETAGGRTSQQQLFTWLMDFRHFNHNNIAHARMVQPSPLDTHLVNGHRYVLFHPLQVGETSAGDELVGILNSIQATVNGSQVAIRLFADPANSYLMGITLGDHMLAGARTWRVRPLPGGDLAVETEAWVQRNGQLNNIAMQYGGRHAMTTVWTRYLSNIGDAATRDGGNWRPIRSYVGYRSDVTRNPFRLRAVRHQWTPPLRPESPNHSQ